MACLIVYVLAGQILCIVQVNIVVAIICLTLIISSSFERNVYSYQNKHLSVISQKKSHGGFYVHRQEEVYGFHLKVYIILEGLPSDNVCCIASSAYKRQNQDT